MAAACALGAFRCQCDRVRRLIARRPRLAKKYGPESRWKWKRDNGCDEDAPRTVAYWNGKPLRRCPPRLLTATWPSIWEIVSWWLQHRKGRATTAPALVDEPAWLLDAYLVMDAAAAEIEQEQRERDEKPLGSGGGHGGATGFRGSPNAPKPSTGPMSTRHRKGRKGRRRRGR